MTAAVPRDFTVLLPPGWIRLPLDDRAEARASTLAAARAGEVAPPQREAARQRLAQLLRQAVREGRAAGGIDIMLSVAARRGVPLAASCLVSYLEYEHTPVPLDLLSAELAGAGGEVSMAEIARGPAVRHQHREEALTRLDYFLPVPGRVGLLALAFSTPMQPLADAFVLLFDAITESLAWQS
jgi:hypothetical protein